MSQIVQKALDFLRPHRPHRLYPLCFVAETTRNNAKRIFELLGQDNELSPADLEEARKLLDDSPKADGRDILNVVNWDGFTLLQRAVIGNQLAFIKLLIKKGVDVNAGICSLPLHLACKLGHVHVAQLLLSFGSRADLESTVCFPEHHKLKTYPDQIYCLAYQTAYTPVTYALIGDHEQVLRLLLHHENSRSLVKTDYLLHEACKMGAHECSRYVLQRYSEQMSMEDTDGKTPLQISLLMDTDNALFLMDNGAEFKDTVFLTEGGTTLHEMYRSKVTLGLVKATKFALEHGFRAHINVRDHEGNTALHVLLRHVGRTVRGNLQADFDREVVDCVKMLLANGADPNLPNHVGESPLHAVLSDNSARQLYVSRHGQVRRLKSILQEICKVSEILLAHGANIARRHTHNFTSPLYYAIRIFQSLQPDMFVLVKAALKHLILLLCHEGCNVNATDSYGLTPLLLILNSSYKWIVNNTNNVTLTKTMMPFISEVMQHFLKRGLDPNAQLTFWTRRMEEAIESNYFKEIILFLNLEVTEDPTFFDNVRHLLIKMGQRGGNPNLLTFTPSYGTPYSLSADIPKDATLSLLLTRALYTQPDATLPAVFDVVVFFNHTLYQHKLEEFLQSILHFTNADFKSQKLDPRIKQRLQQMGSGPRSLKILARIAIADNLEWRLNKKCQRLPLPKALMHYVINFDL